MPLERKKGNQSFVPSRPLSLNLLGLSAPGDGEVVALLGPGDDSELAPAPAPAPGRRVRCP